jgi:uncharacterized membrane protein
VTLIDQRILIDAPTDAVWKILSDPANLAGWAGYTGVSLLTSQVSGEGARRRCTLPNGQAVIEEITAWVDGLGYEYTLVDSTAYRKFQGRIRLQAGPDGTTVQWTISYQPKGLLGAFRDRLGGRRQVAATMAESLRRLLRNVEALGVRMDETERAKVAIRERLNADERAQYRPDDAPPVSPTPALVSQATPTGIEPSGPQPQEDQPPTAAPVPPASMPSFVETLTADMDEPDYSHKADTQPKPPPGLREAIAEQQAKAADVATRQAEEQPGPPEHGPFARPAMQLFSDDVPDYMRVTPTHGALIVQPELETASGEAPEPDMAEAAPISAEVPTLMDSALAEAVPESQKKTPPRGLPSVTPAATPTPDEVALSEIPTDPVPPSKPLVADTEPPPESVMPTPPSGIAVEDLKPPDEAEKAPDDKQNKDDLPPQTPKTDTGEMSIWEAFGVQRPSKQAEAVLDDLMKSIQSKEIRARRVDGRIPKRPLHVRRLRTALGLRLRLVLKAVRVRLRRSWGSKNRT